MRKVFFELEKFNELLYERSLAMTETPLHTTDRALMVGEECGEITKAYRKLMRTSLTQKDMAKARKAMVKMKLIESEDETVESTKLLATHRMIHEDNLKEELADGVMAILLLSRAMGYNMVDLLVDKFNKDTLENKMGAKFEILP